MESTSSLDADEAATLGHLLGAVSRSIEALIDGVEKVYFVAMGENHPHFHVLIAARRVGVPPGERGFAYFTSTEDPGDAGQADKVAVQVGKLLEQAA